MDALTYPWILSSAGLSSIRQLHLISSSRRDLGSEALHSKSILQTALLPLLFVSGVLLMAPLGRIHGGTSPLCTDETAGPGFFMWFAKEVRLM